MHLFSGHLLDTLDYKCMTMCFEPIQLDLQSFSFETSLEVCGWTEYVLLKKMDSCWSLQCMEDEKLIWVSLVPVWIVIFLLLKYK